MKPPIRERIVQMIIGIGAAVSATIGENIVAILATVFANPNEVYEKMGGNRKAKAKYEIFST